MAKASIKLHGEGACPHAPQAGRAVAPRPPPLVRLGEVFDLQMGKTPARANPSFWNGCNKWISIADIGRADVYISETKEMISDEAISASGMRPIPKNTLIMSFKLSIGKVAITTDAMYSNEAIMSFRDLGKYKFDLHYLFHQFKNKDWSSGMNKAVMGVTLNKASLKCHEILLPPLPEQKRIAAILDKICEMKRNAEARLQKLDLLVKARFVEMFGDAEAGTAKYPVVRLEDVCSSLSAGKDVPEDHTKEPDATHLIPIFSNGIERSGLYGYASFARITEPSITISGRGTIGWVCRRMTPFVPIIRLIVATPKLDVVDIVYLESALRGRCAVNTGTTIPQLPVPTAKNIKVIFPPLTLQRQFAAFVEKVEGLKATAKKELEQVDLLYRAKLQEFFG